jgi:hypothetical protein
VSPTAVSPGGTIPVKHHVIFAGRPLSDSAALVMCGVAGKSDYDGLSQSSEMVGYRDGGFGKQIANDLVGVTMGKRPNISGGFFVKKSLGRFPLVILTIAAILLGLGGMHTLSVGAHAQGGHSAYFQMSSAPQPGTLMTTGSADRSASVIAPGLLTPVGGVAAQGCTGLCEMNCLLLGMVCGLSLLFALIGLVVSKLPLPLLSGVRRVMRILSIGTSVFVLPSTPSLHTLSISRT